MKKILSSMFIISILVFSTFFISACDKGGKVYSLTLPDACPEYSIYCNGDYEDANISDTNRIIKAKENSGYEIHFVFNADMDTTNVVVKVNGEVKPHTSRMQEYNDKIEIIIKSEKIFQDSSITIEGIELKKVSLNFKSAKFYEMGSDPSTAVTSSVHMDDTFIRINNEPGGSLEYVSSSGYVPKSFNYGEKIKIFVKSTLPNMYGGHDKLFYTNRDGFEGLFSSDQYNGIIPSTSNAQRLEIRREENYEPYHDSQWWYEYTLELKEDTTIYVNNFALKNKEYGVTSLVQINSMFQISAKTAKGRTNSSHFDYTDDLTIDLVELMDTSALDNATLVINGKEVTVGEKITKSIIQTDEYESINFDVIRFVFKGGNFTPEYFGATSIYTSGEYLVDVKNVNIDLDKNFSLKFNPNENMQLAHHSIYDNDVSGPSSQQNRSSYSDGISYYQKLAVANPRYNLHTTYIFYDKYDYTKAEASIRINNDNSKVFTCNYDTTKTNISFLKNQTESYSHIELDFKYSGQIDSIEVTINNVTIKQISIKYINNFADEVDMSLITSDGENETSEVFIEKLLEGLKSFDKVKICIDGKTLAPIADYYLNIREVGGAFNIYHLMVNDIYENVTINNNGETTHKLFVFSINPKYANLEITLVKEPYYINMFTGSGNIGSKNFVVGEEPDLNGVVINATKIGKTSASPTYEELVFNNTDFSVEYPTNFNKNVAGDYCVYIIHNKTNIKIQFNLSYKNA